MSLSPGFGLNSHEDLEPRHLRFRADPVGPRPRRVAAARGPGAAFFLGTVRSDGMPHPAGLGAVWVDDTLWFVTGPRTRKARHLAANPACTISCRLSGID